MHITDLFATHATTFSFEFFPPRTPEASDRLHQTIADLVTLKPTFVSVTYGADGSTRQLTHDLVVRLMASSAVPAVPHLTCVCHTREQIDQILEHYATHGVGNLLALAGDPPRSMLNHNHPRDAFAHAIDLVRFIREFNASGRHPDRRGFGIGVAGFPEGHPATPNRLIELDHLKAKVDAGADYICTQFFFDNHEFIDFRERCDLAGINVPIIAGIMPVTSVSTPSRMAKLAGGTRFPAPLLRAIKQASSQDGDGAVAQVGIEWATRQCTNLLRQQVRGIHFYTLNQSDATKRIYTNLGTADRPSLAKAS